MRNGTLVQISLRELASRAAISLNLPAEVLLTHEKAKAFRKHDTNLSIREFGFKATETGRIAS
jgi:hypothetical protein